MTHRPIANTKLHQQTHCPSNLTADPCIHLLLREIAIMATCMRAPCLAGSRPTTVPYQRRAFHVARVPNARVTSCKSGWQELVAAAGDVDAPIGVAVGAYVNWHGT